MKKILKFVTVQNLLLMTFGAILGIYIYSVNVTTIDEIGVFSFDYIKTSEDVNFSNTLGLATFDGAWLPVNIDDMVNTTNAVHISCWLHSMECQVAQADLYSLLGKPTLGNKINYYEIKDWSIDGQITAVTSSGCEDDILKADIKNNTVILTESLKENANKTICPQDSKPVILKLGALNY